MKATAPAPSTREIDIDDIDAVVSRLMNLARLILNLASLDELSDAPDVMNALAAQIFNLRNDLIKAGAFGAPTG